MASRGGTRVGGGRNPARTQIGVDTGGTFTDLVVERPEGCRVVKLPSTPRRPERAVLGALRQARGMGPDHHIIHGTTVALNALLTGEVAKTALVTGTGFRDLIEIGRQDRPDIYALHPVKPKSPVPRRLRFEIGQRSWPDPETGELVEVQRPTRAELSALKQRIARSGAKSIAICLLHSYADPAIEQRIAKALAPLGLPITCSGTLLAEHREVERFSTAIANAATVPLLADYLHSVSSELEGAQFSLLQSSGGTLSVELAAKEPARIILSGPAGGVIGAARAARQAGLGPIVALDMGGTSTDVAFHSEPGTSRDDPDEVRRVLYPTIAGMPIGLPALDIHTIGCGGGSLVSIDAGGALQVGPQSAGADPGPVCYGKSERLTVTDAHVLLGHVRSGLFLSGEFALDRGAVVRAFEILADRLSVRPFEAARAVLRAARAAMRRALSVMTRERGYDPAKIPLVAFGGAGGLHAAALARELGMPCALVPALPGALSAWGMAGASARRDAVLTSLEPLSAWNSARRKRGFRDLEAGVRDQLIREGHAARTLVLERSLDLRYRGQAFELSIPDSEHPRQAFERAHERLNGYRLAECEVELVCLRVHGSTVIPELNSRLPRRRKLPARAVIETLEVDFGRAVKTPRIDRRELAPGHRFDGPAIVEEYSGTTLVPPRWSARVTRGGHLLLEP